jgi:hypothetical protein
MWSTLPAIQIERAGNGPKGYRNYRRQVVRRQCEEAGHFILHVGGDDHAFGVDCFNSPSWR